jgi:hypothetical protein
VFGNASQRRRVAAEFVSDHQPQTDAALHIEDTMQKALRGAWLAANLDQDVEHRPILIDSAPQHYRRLVIVSATSSRTSCQASRRASTESSIPINGLAVRRVQEINESGCTGLAHALALHAVVQLVEQHKTGWAQRNRTTPA